MKYVPYSDLSGVPNIIVDGAAQEDTVLTLSHWPGSGSPPEFRADTSTEMVLNYLADKKARKHPQEIGGSLGPRQLATKGSAARRQR